VGAWPLLFFYNCKLNEIRRVGKRSQEGAAETAIDQGQKEQVPILPALKKPTASVGVSTEIPETRELFYRQRQPDKQLNKASRRFYRV
jgi:hypothetical protein